MPTGFQHGDNFGAHGPQLVGDDEREGAGPGDDGAASRPHLHCLDQPLCTASRHDPWERPAGKRDGALMGARRKDQLISADDAGGLLPGPHDLSIRRKAKDSGVRQNRHPL